MKKKQDFINSLKNFSLQIIANNSPFLDIFLVVAILFLQAGI